MSPNPPPVQPGFPHKKEFMSFMYQFIENVVDVVSDGHYGFCVVANLLGLSIDGHHIIRLDLT